MNKGAVELLRVAHRRGFRLQRQIATDCGFDEPRISRLVKGKVTPNRAEALKLREKYGIDPALWDVAASKDEALEAEAEFRERAAVDAAANDAPAPTGTEQ